LLNISNIFSMLINIIINQKKNNNKTRPQITYILVCNVYLKYYLLTFLWKLLFRLLDLYHYVSYWYFLFFFFFFLFLFFMPLFLILRGLNIFFLIRDFLILFLFSKLFEEKQVYLILSQYLTRKMVEKHVKDPKITLKWLNFFQNFLNLFEVCLEKTQRIRK